ncbi:MAG TPA: FAD-dependent oxidoreductase [Gemmatimonadales bacterium]|nr:FAD-dependent oxidoreductase [Gemmatimonadales bacterium]
MREFETIDTVVIGGGQAGLSMGYHLARKGVRFAILEANQRIGDSWRQRWDSLRLFTPARFDGLNGMPFPGDANAFPTKDQMADYLEAYAARFSLPVRTGVRVDRVSRAGDGSLLVSAGPRQIQARNVVVAMADFQRPRIPAFAAALDGSIVQFHSSLYRNLGQLRAGAVLIVGLGNSGAEIAREVVRAGHETYVSGAAGGELPFRLEGRAARLGLARLVFRGVFFRLLRLDTPFGRKAYAKVEGKATPLIRVRSRDLDADGVTRVPRTAGVRDGLPLLEDGRTLAVTNVIWSTGFEPGFSWIDLPVFDGHGKPVHTRGVCAAEPGLCFVGLHFLYAMSSSMIHGVGRDAEYLAEYIGGRPREAKPPAARRRVEAVA